MSTGLIRQTINDPEWVLEFCGFKYPPLDPRDAVPGRFQRGREGHKEVRVLQLSTRTQAILVTRSARKRRAI